MFNFRNLPVQLNVHATISIFSWTKPCKTRAHGRLVVFIALLSTAISLPALSAETVYISDVLYVPLRSGMGNEYRIINRGMKSGTPLTRNKISGDGEWSFVTTETGVEGWVRNQFISEEMTAQLKLSKALTTRAIIDKENGMLKTKNKTLSNTNIALSSKASSETRSREQMASELEKIKQLSADAIAVDQRYRELLETYQLTQTQRDSLIAENENLRDDQRLSFLFYGAGILILGMMLSVILPVLKPKKRHSEWA
ncbi:MAG: SH3 domain protein [Lentisphaeria bacterium]|jgi:SH3 domain protein